MLQYYTTIDNFWKDELSTHNYTRNVVWDAKNFNHLDKDYYNSGYLLQSFNEELSCAEQFKGVLDAHTASVSWTCIMPNVILPTHKDTFYTLRQEHNIEIERCFR